MTNKETIEEFKKVRTDAISTMFDNEDECGIYPTTVFFNTLDSFVEKLLKAKDKEKLEIVESVPGGKDFVGSNSRMIGWQEDWKKKLIK